MENGTSLWLILALLFMLAASFGVPVALAVYLARKQKGLLKAVLVGAACFFVGAMVLEQICHTIVFTLFPVATLKAMPVAYITYACMAAGIFEETARLVGFKLLCRKGQGETILTGFAYGIGHGGIEAILIGGMTALFSLIAVLQAGGAGAQPAVYLAGGIERLLAMTLHVSLSLLVWMTVTKRLPGWGYPLAVLLHALSDTPAALYQCGLLGGNLLICEVLVAFLVLVVGAIVWKLWQVSSNKTTA